METRFQTVYTFSLQHNTSFTSGNVLSVSLRLALELAQSDE